MIELNSVNSLCFSPEEPGQGLKGANLQRADTTVPTCWQKIPTIIMEVVEGETIIEPQFWDMSVGGI